MLPGNQSTAPVRMYRRNRAAKENPKRKDSPSISSPSSDEENEQRALLKAHIDRQVDCLQIISNHDDSGDNIYSKNYDSHRARRGTICRQPNSHVRADDAKLRYSRKKKFRTIELPRYKTVAIQDKYYYPINT